MAIRLSRRLDSGQLDARQWRIVDGTMGERRIEIACPDCGVSNVLDAEHTVHASGVVVPIVSCVGRGCAFMNWIVLDGLGMCAGDDGGDE